MSALRRLLLVACFLISASFAFSQNSSLHGIDLGDLDRTAQPCDDFYQFANGTWRANNPIPASMASLAEWKETCRPSTRISPSSGLYSP